MSVEVTTVVVGLLETNCYIIKDHGEIAVIDPGDDADKILSRIKNPEKVRYIFATHCHIDHIGVLPEIRKHCRQADLYLPKKDIDFAESNKKSMLSEVTYPKINLKSKDLKEGLSLPFGEHQIVVLHTPGHTPGSTCLLIGEKLFSGDTLFYRSLGTTQFPGGNPEEQRESVKKLAKLPDDTIVYPGHLRATSIRMEKESGIL